MLYCKVSQSFLQTYQESSRALRFLITYFELFIMKMTNPISGSNWIVKKTDHFLSPMFHSKRGVSYNEIFYFYSFPFCHYYVLQIDKYKSTFKTLMILVLLVFVYLGVFNRIIIAKNKLKTLNSSTNKIQENINFNFFIQRNQKNISYNWLDIFLLNLTRMSLWNISGVK